MGFIPGHFTKAVRDTIVVVANPRKGCNLRLRQLMQRSCQGMGSPPEQAAITLTAREQEILQGIAQGLSNGEMAELHAISVNTVRCHVKNILTKLDVHDRLQAVRKAKHVGWLK